MDGATGRPHSLNGRFGVLLRQLQATGAADAQVPSGAPPIASRTSTSTVDRLTVALSARLPPTHCSQAVRHTTPHYLGTCTPNESSYGCKSAAGFYFKWAQLPLLAESLAPFSDDRFPDGSCQLSMFSDGTCRFPECSPAKASLVLVGPPPPPTASVVLMAQVLVAQSTDTPEPMACFPDVALESVAARHRGASSATTAAALYS